MARKGPRGNKNAARCRERPGPRSPRSFPCLAKASEPGTAAELVPSGWHSAREQQGPQRGALMPLSSQTTWKKEKHCCFLSVEARTHLGVSCLPSLLQGAL